MPTPSPTSVPCNRLVYDSRIDPELVADIARQTGCCEIFAREQFDQLMPRHSSEVPVLKLDADPRHEYNLSLAAGGKLEQVTRIDFNSGTMAYRMQHNNNIKQAIARAVGVKKGIRPAVIDCTAGIGRDGFILASLGCRVYLLERSPIVHALLADGLRRAANEPGLQATLQNITLILTDSINYLSGKHATDIDVVYMDPMYPGRSKHALVKKDMRLLRQVVGPDEDISVLFEHAINYAAKRVVVKRPKGADFVANRKPSFQITGKTTRYDVYL